MSLDVILADSVLCNLQAGLSIELKNQHMIFVFQPQTENMKLTIWYRAINQSICILVPMCQESILPIVRLEGMNITVLVK